MDSTLTPSLLATTPPGPARFGWLSALLWWSASVVQGALLAWAAVLAQEYYAPLILFPLLVGVCLGATSAGLMRLIQIGHRTTIVVGVVLAILLTVVGQHYLQYRREVAQAQKEATSFQKAQQAFPELTKGAAPVPPDSFGEYLRWQASRGRPLRIAHYVARDGAAWASWAVDGVLVLLAAVAVILPALRQPYCSRCRSWYHAIRSGRLNHRTGHRLAALVRLSPPEETHWIRYRLSDCNSGCGPTRLMLFWEDSQDEQAAAEAWLTAEGRARVTALLDHVRATPPHAPSLEEEPPAPLPPVPRPHETPDL